MNKSWIYSKLVLNIIKFLLKHKQPKGKVKLLNFNIARIEALRHYSRKLLSIDLPLTYWPKKPVFQLQSTCFEELIFEHVFNVRKIKRTAKFDGLEPGYFEDITGIVAPKIGPKSFRTF